MDEVVEFFSVRAAGQAEEEFGFRDHGNHDRGDGLGEEAGGELGMVFDGVADGVGVQQEVGQWVILIRSSLRRGRAETGRFGVLRGLKSHPGRRYRGAIR